MRSCIASDPTEDTERGRWSAQNIRTSEVASPPIRPRILKVGSGVGVGIGVCGCIASDPTEDTESSSFMDQTGAGIVVASPPIRPRILKVPAKEADAHTSSSVASPPIRPRILKVGTALAGMCGGCRCIASDPTEDTERVKVVAEICFSVLLLHRLRSDRGY